MLEVVERPIPEPGPKEVLVAVAVSGVNPTDCKSRRGSGGELPFAEIIPDQDGAGTIVAVGAEVTTARVGERVWIYEANYQRAYGTAAEYLAIDEHHVVELPESASFELGASLGIPALTAHRCLTVGEDGPARLGPGTLAGRTVLVAGGAGAVGHAAIELARWSGAIVVATVSSAQKAALAHRAGAHLVVNYREDHAADSISQFAPGGVDLVVEVASVENLPLDLAVLSDAGTIAIYASGSEPLSLDVRTMMKLNARLQFVYVYTVSKQSKAAAVQDVARALEDGALRVGEEHGLPLVRFPLERCAGAHRAVEEGAVGKVLIEVTSPTEGPRSS